MTLAELATAYVTLRADFRAASDPTGAAFSPIAAEREQQRMTEYAVLIADLVVDVEQADLVGAR